MASATVTLTEAWIAHVRTCTNCEDWWLNDGGFPRCVRGYAISEVLGDELEKAMPAEEPVISGESR